MKQITCTPRGSRGHVSRMAAMDAMGSVVYAARLTDGKVKIGWTEHFGDRLRHLKAYTGQDVTLIGFRFGGRDDEQALHASLAEHRASGGEYANAREYYDLTPEVLGVVNGMRQEFGLPLLAS